MAKKVKPVFFTIFDCRMGDQTIRSLGFRYPPTQINFIHGFSGADFTDCKDWFFDQKRQPGDTLHSTNRKAIAICVS